MNQLTAATHQVSVLGGVSTICVRGEYKISDPGLSRAVPSPEARSWRSPVSRFHDHQQTYNDRDIARSFGSIRPPASRFLAICTPICPIALELPTVGASVETNPLEDIFSPLYIYSPPLPPLLSVPALINHLSAISNDVIPHEPAWPTRFAPLYTLQIPHC